MQFWKARNSTRTLATKYPTTNVRHIATTKQVMVYAMDDLITLNITKQK